jgi:hypothetical protein
MSAKRNAGRVCVCVYSHVLCASESNVETSRVVKEPNALVLVGPHARQDDVVLLASLECVNRGDLELFVQLVAQLSVVPAVKRFHDECARREQFVG